MHIVQVLRFGLEADVHGSTHLEGTFGSGRATKWALLRPAEPKSGHQIANPVPPEISTSLLSTLCCFRRHRTSLWSTLCYFRRMAVGAQAKWSWGAPRSFRDARKVVSGCPQEPPGWTESGLRVPPRSRRGGRKVVLGCPPQGHRGGLKVVPGCPPEPSGWKESGPRVLPGPPGWKESGLRVPPGFMPDMRIRRVCVLN